MRWLRRRSKDMDSSQSHEPSKTSAFSRRRTSCQVFVVVGGVVVGIPHKGLAGSQECIWQLGGQIDCF